MSTETQKITVLNRMLNNNNSEDLKGYFVVDDNLYYACPHYAIMGLKPLIDKQVTGNKKVYNHMYADSVTTTRLPSFKELKQYISDNRKRFKELDEPITMIHQGIKFNCQYLYDIYLLMDYDKQDEVYGDLCSDKMRLLFTNGKNCHAVLMLIRHQEFHSENEIIKIKNNA